MTETCDVVIAGARLSGGAAACTLAKAGRKVIALDRLRFPSDQLSTHLMFSGGIRELQRIGALDRILALDPHLHTHVRLEFGNRVRVEERWGDVDGVDYCFCIPRDVQDMAVVEAERELGVDVRERCEVVDVLWRGGRACGVRYRDAAGDEREIRAKLVIGADGRRSTVAARVGSWEPYRRSRNGRGLVFRYLDDPGAVTDGHITVQWRDGDSLAFAFPSVPRGRSVILFMGAADEVHEARKDPEAYWQRKLDRHPALRERLRGAANMSKLRTCHETTAFFRTSSGPGWALAGDAGHFKDPVIGQGMRDALWMGRTLADAVIPVLDDPAALDAALRRWEHERDRECLPAYHFGNSDTIVRDPSPIFREVGRRAEGRDAPDLGDVFQRRRTLQEILALPRVARAVADAARREGLTREFVRHVVDETRIDLQIRAETRAARFRSTRVIRGSDHPGAAWPDPPRPYVPAAATQHEAVAA